MRATSILGKLVQLRSLPWSDWGEFIRGWLQRKNTGIIPCVLPGSRQLLQIPLRDFYDTYWFFSESKQGVTEIAFFLNQLRPRDVIYDIGAFRGAYGAAAKAMFGEDIAVHLFEPIPKNSQAIRKISQLNRFRQFEIVEKAVGQGTAIRGEFDGAELMLRAGGTSEHLRPLEVATTSIDAYVEHTGVVPSVIKMDVEGFELETVQGGTRCLTEHKPRLWLELHPNFLAAQARDWHEVIEKIRSLGYETIRFHSDYHLPTRHVSFHVWCE